MAIPLESDFMRYIGLGNHYNWYNGSGSCAGIRQAAVRHLKQCLLDCESGLMGQWTRTSDTVNIGTKEDWQRLFAQHEETRVSFVGYVEEMINDGETPPAEYVRYASATMPEWEPLQTPVAPLYPDMLQALSHIAVVCDRSQSKLTKTWEACSCVIQWHLQTATMEAGEREKVMREYCAYLKRQYLSHSYNL